MIAHWNLRALALALSDLIPTDQLLQKLTSYEQIFAAKYRALMRAKLGLVREEGEDDRLIGQLLALMARARADYTLSFRNLTGNDKDWLALFGDENDQAKDWLVRYRERTQSEGSAQMDQVNPRFVLRNWVAETAIRAVEDSNDIATLDRIFRILQSPFEQHDGDEAFAAPPPPDMCHLEVSCSS
jgi:hypothetical protein